ncbi:SpoIIE family protein phosphatase [Streptomyces sp. NBC_01310]|uniref:SpoIIE family protein phosphatase n=1 Tax=Streptomyces sp. NBC_01310 TaxID=2903820 RepID=UPI0035B68F1A|nr:SpoIIE family protein phosphatase [Streptomyces sp. NBC_01310]WSJ63751.1 SpoIIE family protein phosphatase [Streptomyces sp. NBC_01310]
MDSSAHAVVTAAPAAFPMTGAAIALLDAEGTVVGWTQAAERLVGHTAADVVGRSAAFLLADAEDRAKASEFSAQSGDPSRWSGFTTVRHRDGHGIDVRLWGQPLSGQDGRARWVVSAAEAAVLSSWATGGSGVVSLPGALHLPSSRPVGVVIRDTELRCTWVNDAQGARDGIPLDRRLGRTPTQAAPGPQADTLEALMRQVLDSGVPTINVELRSFAPPHVRRESTLLASFFRLDDARGRALGVCAVIVDVTDSSRARERLAVLGEAGKRLGTTLDAMSTGQELADLAVPLLADYATVDLMDSVPSGEKLPARPGPQGGPVPVFRRAGLASIHPDIPEALFARGEPVLVPPASPLVGVLRSGESHFVPGTPLGTWLAPHDAARAEKVREHAMHSLMVVPIQARGAVLGVAVFVRTDGRVPFDQDDLLLAEELVGWAALSLDNARRYAREASAALALQRHLLPHHASGGDAADVAWRYLPADSHHGVGGDWFDVIQLSGARVALVVGDVAGHGINAAATMGQLRATVHTLADMDLAPDELLARLDEQVIRLAEADADPGDPAAATIAATCLYAVYDPVTRQCTIARAGHPPPAIVDPDGGVTFPDLPTGAPLGVGLVPFESATLELPEGSMLALYTDGLIEARDHDIDVGMDRLGAALAGSGPSLEDLGSSVVETLSTCCDDITLLLARTRSLGPDQVATWEFPADPSLVGSARALAGAQLARWGLEHLTESTELIVSELVTNAIRHGSGPVRLRLIRHRVLTCEVHDTSGSSPRACHPRATDENGRGLLLVGRLSRRWGTRHTPDGKLIWAEQPLTPGR